LSFSDRGVTVTSDNGGLIGAVTSQYAMWRGFFTRASGLFQQLTFRIPPGSEEETIAQLSQRWKLSDEQRQFLVGLCGEKAGATFFTNKIEEMNRAAVHRSAFALNAVTHLFFVDIGAQLFLSLPQIKWFFVLANLCVAWIAHASIRQELQALLAGPNALPPRRRMGGLLPNPDYNRAVKESSVPHARSAWREKSLYRPAYFINAAAIFLGSQFILAPEKLIFPFGLILRKTTGLFSTVVMLFDVWRGVKSGDDARSAREKEISVYGNLDI
jgi:hypothetical protein